MSTTTQAPQKLDPSASLHPETLGLAPGRGRLAGRKIIVVGAGQRKIVDVGTHAEHSVRHPHLRQRLPDAAVSAWHRDMPAAFGHGEQLDGIDDLDVSAAAA